MLTILLLSIAIPSAAFGAYLTLRGRVPALSADVRGIALQTVIIMVVLLAIAGAIAGVLLTRGGDAVADVERQQVSRTANDYERRSLCLAAGFNWTAATTVTSGTHCTT